MTKTKKQIWEEYQIVLDKKINKEIEMAGQEQYEQLLVTKSKSEVIVSKTAPRKKTLFEKVTGLKPKKRK